MLVTGGRQEGVFVDPTILDRVSPAMRIYYEECFGPVASVIRVTDDDEAVSVANDTEYGLAAAVFSRDIARALEMAPAGDRHLPYQLGHHPRRAADAVRRRQGVGLRPFRRQGRDRRIHRTALDHHPARSRTDYPF